MSYDSSMAGIRRKKLGSEHKVFMIPVLDGENECVTICVTVILLLFFLSAFFCFNDRSMAALYLSSYKGAEGTSCERRTFADDNNGFCQFHQIKA